MGGDSQKRQGGSKPKWMYVRDGVQRGPVTSKDLQALANRGELLPSDLIWKEGMKDWVRADKSSVVFPSSDADPLIRIDTTTSAVRKPDSQAVQVATGKSGAKATLASAGSLIAKKTERTKLATVTIPRAYAELGKSVYKDTSKRIAFTSEFEQLDKLLAERKRIHEDAKARPSANTFADKAKQVAAEATDLAKTKAIDLKVYHAFASLGESAYTQVGADVGPQDVIAPLATAIARRDALDKETASIEHSAKGQWITPRRLVIGGGVLLGLMVMGMISRDSPPTPPVRKRPTPMPHAVTEGGKGTANDRKPNKLPPPADVGTAPADAPKKGSPRPEPTAPPTPKPPADPKHISTKKTYYPNGQLHEEITLANEKQDGISRAWYSNGCLRDEMTFANGVLARGKYLARSGRAIFEYQMERQWTPQMSSYDFSHGPDGQEVRPYTDTQEIIPVVDVNKDGFGAVGMFVDDSKKPPGGWPVVTLEAGVYADDDLGEVFHGVVRWKTQNSLNASDFRFDDATSMKYDGTGSICHVASRRHGPFLLFYPSGAKWARATFVNNFLHGQATVWYENGQAKEEIPFLAGQWDGTYRAWHENGQKAREIAFVQDRRHGVRLGWSKDGKLVTEGLFREGKKDGPHKTWWLNGKLASEQTYEEGTLSGPSREWNEQGVLLYDVAYKDGIPQGSKVFENAVSRLRGIGFSVQPCRVIQTADGYKHLGSAIGVKSDGENDMVVYVGEFMPLTLDQSEKSDPIQDAILSRNTLALHVGYMLSSICQMPEAFRKALTFTDPENSSGWKTPQNGSTEFVGIMLIGDKQCEVTWRADSRFGPDPEVWKVETDGAVIMTAADYNTDQRPSVTRVIMNLLSGGRRW